MARRLLIAALCVAVTSTAWAQVRTSRTAVKPRTSETLLLLQKRIPEVSFDEATFEGVLDWLAQITGANLKPQWQVLEDSGVMRDAPISLNAKNLTLAQVLWIIMREAAGPDLKLAYRASGNTIIISTDLDLSREMVVKIYDVRDLLISSARFEAPQMDPSQAMQTGGQSGGGGSQLFQSGTQMQQQQAMPTAGESPELEKLKKIIMATIAPDSWAEGAAGKGTIDTFNGMLIIYNTPFVHQQIGGYLEEETPG